jgi:hypothetical protein
MKAYERVEVELHIFLISELEEDEWAGSLYFGCGTVKAASAHVLCNAVTKRKIPALSKHLHLVPRL